MSEPGRSVTVRLPSAQGLRPIVGVLAVALVIAGLVVGGVRTHHAFAENSRLEHSLSSYELGALATARSYAITFATYSYSEFDADLAATEAHSAEPFLSQYKSETAQLSQSIVKLKSTSSAKVISTALASITSTSAVVDLFLDQTIKNSKGSQTYAQRVEMTLVRPHGRWLISKVLLP